MRWKALKAVSRVISSASLMTELTGDHLKCVGSAVTVASQNNIYKSV